MSAARPATGAGSVANGGEPSDEALLAGLVAGRLESLETLAMRGLPGTTGTQVYEAWAIGSDGNPVPIGGFTVGSDGVAVATVKAPAATAGTVLALTLEPGPGATTPTPPIVARGVANPASALVQARG